MFVDLSEHVPAPRSRELSFYLVLFCFVGPIWALVPLSWLYALYSIHDGKFVSYSSSRLLGLAFSLCEVAFHVYYTILARRVGSIKCEPYMDVDALQRAFKRVLQSGLVVLPEDGGDEEYYANPRATSPDAVIEQLEFHDERAIDYRNRMRTWFGGVPWSRVRRAEFKQWLYWSTFNCHMAQDDELPESHKTLMEEAVELIQMRVGSKVPEGSDPSIKPLRLTIDPVGVRARPLVWYIFVKAINIYVRWQYGRRYGLSFGRYKDLEYLLRVPPDWNRETGPDPVVFLHGLGLGIWQYQSMITHFLKELPDVPILIPIQPQISQDIFHMRYLKPMLRDEKVACLTGVLNDLGWVKESEKERKGVTVVSHSNGTFVHAWILKTNPQIVTRSCFVDPVTFCLWEGDVCNNFIYKPCVTGTELVLRYFVATELGVACLLQRHFNWLYNTLWFEEIPHARDPQKALYILGGQDSILDSARIRKYLIQHGIKDGLYFDPEARHGQSLLVGGSGITKVLAWIKDESRSHPTPSTQTKRDNSGSVSGLEKHGKGL